MNELTLPWPLKALSPNAISRNSKGWLIKQEKNNLSDFEEAHRLFSYNADTGIFVRKITIGMRAKSGTCPGYMNHGYMRIRFRGKTVEAHRLAWLMVNGTWPQKMIDHLNGNKSDNRISNLRNADHRLNLENQRNARSDNKLGVLGVREKSNGKFESRIWVNGKSIHLGIFKTIDQASDAYIKAKRSMHKGCTL